MNRFKLLKKIVKIQKVVNKDSEIEKDLSDWVQKEYGTTLENLDLSITDAEKLINYYESKYK